MSMQINLRISEGFLEQAKEYAKNNGFLNVQEFIRDAAREKIFGSMEVRPEYLERLNSIEANTFLSDGESEEFERELKKRAQLE
ncbi:hypothetical protein COV18_02240 [Candidatus Woesearchaeota archaeon CG10_big_fil_rev_8_21_14_0_10_37_12]|nr:MAG: hypothetical protein COV18_02240 [Candidatus Woesearchaeota archaeon CG10_big_fil_rev_8_21_14_0_10_37_12]